jgi:Phage integrase, N-terminal SAM-like domain
LLDQWLTTVVKARVRTRTFKDYEALLKLYIRPALGGRLIGTLSQIGIQDLYAQMFERGLSARTTEYANAVLRSAFRQAVRWKMLAEDLLRWCRSPTDDAQGNGGSERRRVLPIS